MVTHQATHTKKTVQVKSYPAPKQLATATDLTPQETQAITEAINPLIADSLAMYMKTNVSSYNQGTMV
jgi:starvation-inducible DNA-binding protein